MNNIKWPNCENNLSIKKLKDNFNLCYKCSSDLTKCDNTKKILMPEFFDKNKYIAHINYAINLLTFLLFLNIFTSLLSWLYILTVTPLFLFLMFLSIFFGGLILFTFLRAFTAIKKYLIYLSEQIELKK